MADFSSSNTKRSVSLAPAPIQRPHSRSSDRWRWASTALFAMGCLIWFSVGWHWWTSTSLSPTPKSLSAPAKSAFVDEETTVSFAAGMPDRSEIPGDVERSPVEQTPYDPIVESSEIALLAAGPFDINNPESTIPHSNGAHSGNQASQFAPLSLTSIIVGEHRRAAVINSRLCFEGTRLHVQGREFRVTRIEPHRVALQDGPRQVELTLPTHQSAAGDNGIRRR